MKFMLMMNAPNGTGDWDINKWTPDDFKAHMEFMHSLNRELTDAGEIVALEGLTPPNQAVLVRVGPNGAPITDGPFPETKEFLAGFWIVDVPTAERAYQIAAKVSSAPGPGGKPLIIPVEVRPVGTPPDPNVNL